MLKTRITLCLVIPALLTMNHPSISHAENHPVQAVVQVLSADSFTRAGQFIERTGRPLERALYAQQFHHGERAAVIAALATFQNPDGGFAARLESDHRWDGSTTTATMVALRILDRVQAPATNAHVRAAIKYLLATFDEQAGYWHAMPAEANVAPHAPWWEVHANGKCDVESPVFPTAAIAAHLPRYASLLPPGFLERITTASLKYLDDASLDIAMPDVDVLIDLVSHLPDAERANHVDKLRRVLDKDVERDPTKWQSYGIQPTTYIESPRSPFYQGLEQSIALNLDYIISKQSADGGWDPNWSWSDVDASAWATALAEIRATITLQNLSKLNAYQRIAGR